MQAMINAATSTNTPIPASSIAVLIERYSSQVNLDRLTQCYITAIRIDHKISTAMMDFLPSPERTVSDRVVNVPAHTRVSNCNRIVRPLNSGQSRYANRWNDDDAISAPVSKILRRLTWIVSECVRVFDIDDDAGDCGTIPVQCSVANSCIEVERSE